MQKLVFKVPKLVFKVPKRGIKKCQKVTIKTPKMAVNFYKMDPWLCFISYKGMLIVRFNLF